jgi:hypothetical protein
MWIALLFLAFVAGYLTCAWVVAVEERKGLRQKKELPLQGWRNETDKLILIEKARGLSEIGPFTS